MEQGRKTLSGFLREITLSERGCFAVTSIDRRPLEKSGRMVLVYSTRTANSGMEWDATEEYLVKRGNLPVLMRTGRFHVALSNPADRKFRCFVLNISGERIQEIPVVQEKGLLKISADTARTKEISPFFELIAEELLK